jgi:dTDP-4-dehydrorhamnose reductase
MLVLLLGGTGQVGRECLAIDWPDDVELVAPDRAALDLARANAIAEKVAARPWDIVINAAAYTQVDRAESDRAAAFAVNAEAPRVLAEATQSHRIPLIHLSTDYVFDGNKGAPYTETDAPAPLNVYGESKLAGEAAVAETNPRHVIIRPAWIYSPHGQNFVKTILRLAGERDRLAIVDDQRGSPTAARDIAAVCRDIALHIAATRGNAPYGIYHYCAAGETTWFGFAKAIVEMASPRSGGMPELVPITTAEYPTPAKRPRDTRLDCAAIIRAFGARQRPWREALQETLAQLLPDGKRP